MVLSTETFNQSVCTEYSEAVNARYTFHPLCVSVITNYFLSFKNVFSNSHLLFNMERIKQQPILNQVC